jgi:hypothetical protein
MYSCISNGILFFFNPQQDPSILDSQIEVSATSSDNSKETLAHGKEKKIKKVSSSKSISLGTGKLEEGLQSPIDQLPTDMSDSTDSEQGKTTMRFVIFFLQNEIRMCLMLIVCLWL